MSTEKKLNRPLNSNSNRQLDKKLFVDVIGLKSYLKLK